MVEKLKIEPDFSEYREAIGYAPESELLELQNKALSDALDKANALLATRHTGGLVGALEWLIEADPFEDCEDWQSAKDTARAALSAHKGAAGA